MRVFIAEDEQNVDGSWQIVKKEAYAVDVFYDRGEINFFFGVNVKLRRIYAKIGRKTKFTCDPP